MLAAENCWARLATVASKRWKANVNFRGLATESTAEDIAATGLPLSQRCKNLLAGNWRAQVTVANASALSDGSQPQVVSFLADYAAPRGLMPPAVLLHRHTSAEHLENLKQSSLASITIGRTDPSEVVQKVNAAGLRLPCLSILGDLVSMQRAELGYVLRRAQKVSSRLPGWPFDWESRAADPDIEGLSMDIQQIRYVDMTGGQHGVSTEEMDGAFLDPLASGLVRLLSSVNTTPSTQLALQSFCWAYMNTLVTEALMTQADRSGFTLLAKPEPSAVKDPELKGLWREFRFTFDQDVSNADAFMNRLDGMRSEAAEMLNKK